MSSTSLKQCVTVNVGKKSFNLPFVKLIEMEPESNLTALVREQWKPSAGRREITIERPNPELFQFIVSYFNDGVSGRWPHDQNVIKQLMNEAEYFQLFGMVPLLWRLMNRVPLITPKLEVQYE